MKEKFVSNFKFVYVLSQMQYRDCFPGFSNERIIFLNFKFMYVFSQMQYRDCFPCF